MTASPPPSPDPVPAARLVQAFDALDEGVAVLGADGTIEFVNATALSVLKVQAEEIVGRRFQEISWEILDGDERPLPRSHHPALRVLETGEPEPVRVLGVRAPSLGDDTIWVAAGSRPMRDAPDGPVTGSVSFFRDVTPTRRAHDAERALRGTEARYRTLVSMVPVGIFQTDLEGRCEFVNGAWSRVAGVSPAQALGDGWTEALHPEDRDRVIREWSDAAHQAGLFHSEYRFRRPDGETRWVVATAVPFKDPDGSPAGFLGSVTDITEQKSIDQMKDQLIGMVSHELRAPLVSIGGALRYLEPQLAGLDDQGRHLYEMAMRNTLLLERMISDLLDLDRLESGADSLDVKPTPVEKLLEAAYGVCRQPAEEAQVSLAIPSVRDLKVRADHDRILQVLTNLVSNAIRFSEPGSTVSIEVAEEGDRIRMSVRDTGRGIPEDQLERIFERFTQVEAADAQHGGAGLGLTIARAIVERHGGRLSVESAPGEGSTFSFTLPRAR